MRIFFYCIEAAEKGGETPIADVRKVYEQIDPSIRKPFEEKGVLYVRNLAGGPFGFTWQEVYQTQDKAEMERFCKESETDFEWIDEKKVRTKQLRPAVAKHPVTGELLWLNHATVLNVFAIEPKLQQMLLKFFKEKDLPNNTYYGDGTSISKDVIGRTEESIRFCDNCFQMGTGRCPHAGQYARRSRQEAVLRQEKGRGRNGKTRKLEGARHFGLRTFKCQNI